MEFKADFFEDINDVIKFTKSCQKKNHIQQVAFSTYHNSLTQVCFNCEMVRTNINSQEIPPVASNDFLKSASPTDTGKSVSKCGYPVPDNIHTKIEKEIYK